MSALAAESIPKHARLGFWGACKDTRLLLIVTGYFFYILGFVTNALWMPTFLQRISNLPAATVARFVMIPALAGALGLLINSWSSDRSGEHKWHTVIPIFCGGCCYLGVGAVAGHFPVIVLLFTLYYLFSTAAFASLWAMPTTFLSTTTAAAAFGLINCIGQTGGFFGPSIVGYLNDSTGSIHRSVIFIGCSLLVSAITLSFLRSQSSIYRNDVARNRQEIAFEANIGSQEQRVSSTGKCARLSLARSVPALADESSKGAVRKIESRASSFERWRKAGVCSWLMMAVPQCCLDDAQLRAGSL